MDRSPSPSNASPLLGHINTLYPLACLLTGPDEAPYLLIQVYQRAAEHPPAERPTNTEAWLLDLLREMSESPASGGEAEADMDQAPADDPLRLDVAGDLLERALPIALAACSSRERFLLALDAFETTEPPSEPDIDDDSFSDAYATLRTKLREILSGPEYDLVDEALSPTALRDAVRDWVATQFGPAPSSLRARIRTTLQTTPPTGEARADAEERSEAEASDPDRTLPSRLSPRALLLTLLIGALVVAGGIGVTSLMQSSSTSSSGPSTSLVAFSAERASSVTPALQTSSRSEAEAYVRSTWGRQIQVPRIQGTQLRGVGRGRANGVEIPVLLYADTGDSTRITTFVYNYALVNRLGTTAMLGPQLRRELARPGQPVAQTEASAEGLLWRDRDDIFVAVAPSIPPDSLRARLRP